MKELQGPIWGARASQINSLIQRVSEPQKSVIPYKLPDSHSYEENFDRSVCLFGHSLFPKFTLIQLFLFFFGKEFIC